MADKSSALMQRLLSGSPRQRLLLIGNSLLIVIAIIMATLLGLLFVRITKIRLLFQERPYRRLLVCAGIGLTASPLKSSQLRMLTLVNWPMRISKPSFSASVLSERTSSATIAFNGRPEKVYHIGDKLGSAIVIKQIQPFRVIVEQNGARRQIKLEKADSCDTDRADCGQYLG